MNREQAERIVSEVAGGDASTQDALAWHAVKFEGGWMFIRSNAEEPTPARGAPRYVVDDVDGSVRRIPSGVPSPVIFDSYAAVKASHRPL